MSRKKTRALRAMTVETMRQMGLTIPTFDLRKREFLVRAFQQEQGLTVDGWPGTKTYYALWQKRHVHETPATLVERARRWCEVNTAYALGKGGVTWFPDFPEEEIDCSGFVAACLLRSRAPQADFPRWLATDSIYDDCAGKQLLFVETEPRPGALAVYPDHRGRQGHVGIVTEAQSRLRGVDCSMSNDRRGDAVVERDFSFFLEKENLRFAYPRWFVRCLS